MKVHFDPSSAYWPVAPCGVTLWTGESTQCERSVTCKSCRKSLRRRTKER